MLGASRSANKTDTVTLLTNFGSLSGIMQARGDELRLCPGIGDTKADRLQRVFDTPFQRAKQPRATAKAQTPSMAVEESERANADGDGDLAGLDLDGWDNDDEWDE